ncbi:hypothetical protein [Caulobacter sp. 1776]|uniref:hypothetical protein n=1 Tax=Caulobacter sp. 1776 TaxID=3156420 RepID=UPI00339B09B3
MNVNENQLLGFFLKPLDGRQAELIEDLGEGRSDALRRAMASFLSQAANGVDDRYVTARESDLPTPPDFKSVVWQSGAKGPPRMIVFNFKDAFQETALPLFGLILSLCANPLSWADLPTGVDILQKLWSRLSILKAPEHADAIALLKALALAQAERKLAKSPEPPTWSEVSLKLGASLAVTPALDMLLDKKIVEIVHWGDQAQDRSHPDNRLRITL